MVWFILLLILLIFIGVIVIRTIRFVPKGQAQEEPLNLDIPIDEDAAVSSLGKLIQCRTISYRNPSLEDDSEFEKLLALLPELFPIVCKNCPMTKFSGRAVLFRWKGTEDGDPAVFMSHYDVVPAEEEQWSHPPFDAVVDDGALWGRGTQDNKNTLNGIMTAAENLLRSGFTPQHDIYFAFSGSEEIDGDGAASIVRHFTEMGISPSLVLDEGGAVVEDIFPGVTKPCAMIGTAEKGYADLTLTTRSNGGHASAPCPGSPITRLSAACQKLESHPMKYRFSEPILEMFDTVGRYSSSFLYRMIFANLWCFGWLINLICVKNGGQLNALIRSTIAFTQMFGSQSSNVIPPSASMTANIRIGPKDSISSVESHIRRIIRDNSVEISSAHVHPASPISRTDCDSWLYIKNAAEATWKGCIATPYVMLQGSDSSYYSDICDKVYRFSASDMTSEEINGIHGNDERIRLTTIRKTIEFYIRVMREC